MSDLELLKLNLLEASFPFFSDTELNTYLTLYGTVQKATYELLLVKAQDDSVSLGPIKTPSNEKFWLRRARQFRVNSTGVSSSSGAVIMKRYDEPDPE